MLYAFIYDTTTFLWSLCLNVTHISTRAGTYKLVDICHNQTDLILENIWRCPKIWAPKNHPVYNRIVIRFPISHEINHPAIGVSQLQGERSTAADMCRYMDQRLQAGLQPWSLGFWGYLEVGHGSSIAGLDCMVPTYQRCRSSESIRDYTVWKPNKLQKPCRKHVSGRCCSLGEKTCHHKHEVCNRAGCCFLK